ncbi:MAG: hypothetical protein CMJ16_01885 [Peredibacter sp.]|nr:hypothetical protein [Peredibacter sp.]
MNIEISQELFNKVISDLNRRHEFAFERVGYLMGTFDGETLVFDDWLSFDDEHYVNNDEVGARIGPEGMSLLMKTVFKTKKNFFHTHIHDFQTIPMASFVDERSWKEVNPALYDFSDKSPHGGIIIGKKCTLIKYWKDNSADDWDEIFIEKGCRPKEIK